MACVSGTFLVSGSNPDDAFRSVPLPAIGPDEGRLGADEEAQDSLWHHLNEIVLPSTQDSLWHHLNEIVLPSPLFYKENATPLKKQNHDRSLNSRAAHYKMDSSSSMPPSTGRR
jgi:hypothetical protein